MLVATMLVVGLLLGADLVLGAAGWGNEYRRPLGVSLSLAAALIGGGRVVYLRHRSGGKDEQGKCEVAHGVSPDW